LCFIEQEALHDMGKGQADAEKKRLGGLRVGTPLAIYVCPTRRKPIAYPYIHDVPSSDGGKGSSPYTNITIGQPHVIARTDYAINGGTYHEGSLPYGSVGDDPYLNCAHPELFDGISYLRSQVEKIDDGASNTYLVGERCVNSDEYYTGRPPDDDQGWDLGFDWDVVRWTYAKPQRDRAGVNNSEVFGSAHAAGWHMVFCDGAVRMLSYGIDEATHKNLGSRNDHIPIDQSKLPPP
jgi:hypothetical protein